jgi:hypothetical protein
MDTRFGSAIPYTLRYCQVCQKKTPHEIRTGAGLTAIMCVTCLETGRKDELDREAAA